MVYTNHRKEPRPAIKVEFHNDNLGTVTTVTVPEGTLITDAADQAGIKIPQLCHHPRLKPAGRCGLCVVSVEDAPNTTQLACSTYCKKQQNMTNGDTTTGMSTNTDTEDSDDDLGYQNISPYGEDGVDMKIHVNGTDLNGLANAAMRRNMEHSMVYQEFQKRQLNSNKLMTAPSGCLEIEDLGNFLKEATIDTSSASITYDPSLCVGCSRCTRACGQLQGMDVLDLPVPVHSEYQSAMGIAQAPPCMTTKAGRPLKDTDCISCGQCTLFCPTGAIQEVDHTARVMQALLDPEMTVVLQTAPSTRVTISEMFGGKPGDCPQERLVGAAKACGFQYVFDTLVGADLTIIEEAHELLKRLDIAKRGSQEKRKKKPLPMFTSCCPAWINLVEQSYPELIPHLSSCRSPMAMLSSVIRYQWWPQQQQTKKKGLLHHAWPFHLHHKQDHHDEDSSSSQKHRSSNYHRHHDNHSDNHHHSDDKHHRHRHHHEEPPSVDQSTLFVVAVMPCTAKKDEIRRKQLQMKNGKPETDAVLTVREFARLMELRGVAQRNNYDSFASIPLQEYDSPLGEATGAANIFGATGGVMEAALRTAADFISHQDLKEVNYETVRGMQGVKEAKVHLGENINLSVAACHQMANVRDFLDEIKKNHMRKHHFIEVMTCPGGCIGGGGLPQSRDPNIIQKRMSSIYSLDERKVKRKAHENMQVQHLYDHWLEKPLSHLSHKLLHTKYFARPRKPLPLRKAQRRTSIDISSCADRSETITILYGSEGGTSASAAKEIKHELKKYLRRSGVSPNMNIFLVAGDDHAPEKLVHKVSTSFLSIFVTPTYDDGVTCFPRQLQKFWQHLLLDGDDDTFASMNYAVFGLGSTMYAAFEDQLFCRAAKILDLKIEEFGGDRLVPLGLGDEMDPKNYKTALDKWTEILLPKVAAKIEGGNAFEDATAETTTAETTNDDSESFPKTVSTTADPLHESLGFSLGKIEEAGGPILATIESVS